MNSRFILPVLLAALLLEPSPLRANNQGPICGIGIVATDDAGPEPPGAPWGESTVPEYLLVHELIPGGPAMKAGIFQGDHIIEIDGRKVAGMRFKNACNLLRGAPGTQVKVTVQRGGQSQDFTLTRELLNLHA